MTAPDRTTAQRLDALARANDVRIARAGVKELIAANPTWRTLLLVLAGRGDELALPPYHGRPRPRPAGYLDGMKVYDALLAAPAVGRVKANRLLMTVRVSPSKTLAGLSDRQRLELVDHVRALALHRRATSRTFHPTTRSSA